MNNELYLDLQEYKLAKKLASFPFPFPPNMQNSNVFVRYIRKN